MKKYLLSLLVVGLSFIGFSSAGNITFISNGISYTPSQITFVSNGSFNVSSYSCREACNIDFCDDDYNFCCGVQYSEEGIVIQDCGEIPAGTYNLYDTDDPFDSITLSSSSFEDNTGGGTGGDDNIGGGTGGDDNIGGGIIEGGTSQLSPVVSAIYSVMLQFIPYVVYIGIGILLCTLGFYAIKWLVNWLTSKITNYFK